MPRLARDREVLAPGDPDSDALAEFWAAVEGIDDPLQHDPGCTNQAAELPVRTELDAPRSNNYYLHIQPMREDLPARSIQGLAMKKADDSTGSSSETPTNRDSLREEFPIPAGSFRLPAGFLAAQGAGRIVVFSPATSRASKRAAIKKADESPSGEIPPAI